MSAAVLLYAFLCTGSGRRVQYPSKQSWEAIDEALALAQLLRAAFPNIGWQPAGTQGRAALAKTDSSAHPLKVNIAPRAGVPKLAQPKIGSEEYMQQFFDPLKSGQFSKSAVMAKPGLNGYKNRFIYQDYGSRQMDTAVLLAVAGAYPGLTAQQLLAPIAPPHPEPGKWNFHILTTEAAPGGYVALHDQEAQLSKEHPNVVVVVCTMSSLGFEPPEGIDHEILAVVDRDDIAVQVPQAFSPEFFYTFADTDGVVQIRTVDEIPAGWSIVGRVLFVRDFMRKHTDPSKKPCDGFAECRDDFEF